MNHLTWTLIKFLYVVRNNRIQLVLSSKSKDIYNVNKVINYEKVSYVHLVLSLKSKELSQTRSQKTYSFP